MIRAFILAAAILIATSGVLAGRGRFIESIAVGAPGFLLLGFLF